MSKLGQIDAYLLTDTGRIREHNEDFIDFREPATPDEEVKNGWLYIVADGVGGADAGEVASQYASERTIAHYLEASDESDWGKRLYNAMQAANTDLRQFVLDRTENSRMATTMVAAVIQDNNLFVSNVGDSRGYHWHNGELRQITKDQSLVARLVEEGAITEEEALVHPRKNVILYSLGSENRPTIDLFRLTWTPGDVVLLCSDGLTRHVSDAEIAEVISRYPARQATETLVQLANERGGEDNISVAIIRYKPDKQAAKQTAVADNTQAVAQLASSAGPFAIPAQYRSFLWLYTIVLSIIQSFLIFLAWLLLRV